MNNTLKVVNGQVINTLISKNHYNNWVAKTSILLDEVRKLQLTLHTSKVSSGKLVTSASVSKVSGDGMSTTHAMFQDFNIRIFVENPSRCTAKVVQAQHEQVDIEAVITEAKRFYNLV